MTLRILQQNLSRKNNFYLKTTTHLKMSKNKIQILLMLSTLLSLTTYPWIPMVGTLMWGPLQSLVFSIFLPANLVDQSPSLYQVFVWNIHEFDVSFDHQYLIFEAYIDSLTRIKLQTFKKMIRVWKSDTHYIQ